jgi:hypothetical protein
MDHLSREQRHETLSRATAVVYYAEQVRHTLYPADIERCMGVLRDAVETLYKLWFGFVVFMQDTDSDTDLALITTGLLNATANTNARECEKIARQVVSAAGRVQWMRIPQSPFVRAFVTHLTAWRDSVRDELSDAHVTDAIASALHSGYPFSETDRRYLQSDNSALARAHTAFLDARACLRRPQPEAQAFLTVMQLSDAIARRAFELRDPAKSRLRNLDVRRGELALPLAAALRELWASDILERSREALSFQ